MASGAGELKRKFPMNATDITLRWPVLASVGVVAGAAIAAVDNFAFGGEVSPILIVVMLLAATGIAGLVWDRRGWVAAAAAWICVPLAHLIKHVLGLPDTMQPNTYTSILMLAAFTLAVATIGTGCGILLRRLTAVAAKRGR
jgi:hypothetical protein